MYKHNFVRIWIPDARNGISVKKLWSCQLFKNIIGIKESRFMRCVSWLLHLGFSARPSKEMLYTEQI